MFTLTKLVVIFYHNLNGLCLFSIVTESTQKMHPFEEEITSLLDNPTKYSAFCNFTPSSQSPEMSTSYNWINTEAQLENLARLLGEEKAFGVDTEQHSFRSFLGYTALVQVIANICVLDALLLISLLRL
jgi:hypothetical protein